MFVEERFVIDPSVVAGIHELEPVFGFNGLGETVFYRTYSRKKDNGAQETWADLCVRVIEGGFSVAKDLYLRKQKLHWDEDRWQKEAANALWSMFLMHWLPSGRMMWISGTDHFYRWGSAAAFNCAWVDVRGKRHDGTRSVFSRDMNWMTDMLMCGVGVGFSAQDTGMVLHQPVGMPETFVVPDTRGGWAESVERLIASYENGTAPVVFDYSEIRPLGAPIRSFGGVASGPDPLKELHDHIRDFCNRYLEHLQGIRPDYTETMFVADVGNSIGRCVVAGNVRRSAEICLGQVDDEIFRNLKNWERFPERNDMHTGWSHLSNNSVVLKSHADFLKLPGIAEGIRRNGEPGFLNMINIREYGRIGDHAGTEVIAGYVLPVDHATGCNPCGEIPLESYETCCLTEVFPTRVRNTDELMAAIRCATMYATFIQWLPTHRPETNEINRRNARIGVSLSGIFDWYERDGMPELVRCMRDGYKLVRQTNLDLANEAGMRPAVRVTTVKPSGSISKLVGCSAGVHAPEYQTYIRRMRVAKHWEGRDALDASGYRHEPDVKDPDNTEVYEFLIHASHEWPVRTVNEVSMWEQAMLVMAVQRHWADNMVSATLKFREEEADAVEKLLGLAASNMKSTSMMQIFDPMMSVMQLVLDKDGNVVTGEDGKELYEAIKKAAYPQLPEEPITYDDYVERKQELRPIDWSRYSGDGEDERYCTTCEVDLKALYGLAV